MANPGTILNGRFRLDQLVGQGGFAQVFLSTDLLLDRQVAVKVLRPDQLADTDTAPFIERFGAEARLIARLEHPNILGLYDYGQSDELIYLVMPYVAGGSLHDARRRVGRFTPAQVTDYLRQIAAALDYAHANNIVHRDIKPQNVLLRAGTDQLIVADFGIAKVLREGNTQSGTAVIGSAAYMAPEQFQGRVGRATDIYALGCVAFELLTATPPYPGPAERSMFGHIYGALPRLDATLPDASPAMQAVIDRALAKQPEDRFPSAGALAIAFSATIGTASGQALPLPEEQATRRLDPAPSTGQPPALATPPPYTAPPPPVTGEPPPTGVLPTGALPAPPPARSRSLVPWLAVGIVTLLVIIGIGIGLYLNRPDPDTTGAGDNPTATTQTSAASQPTATSTRGAGVAPAATTARPTAPNSSGGSTRPGAVTGLAERKGATLPGHTNRAERAAWSPDGEYLATASEDSTVFIWHKDGREKAKLTAHTKPVRSLAWSENSEYLATGGNDGFVHFWQLGDTVNKIDSIDNEGNGVSALAWHDTTLVVASAKIRFYNVENQTEFASPADSLLTNVLAWSPDGQALLAGGDNGLLRVFTATGQLAETLQGHTGDVTSIAWSPGNDRFVSAANEAILWQGAVDTATGKVSVTSKRLVGHTATVTSVAWSPDNDTIATGSDDRTVRLWGPDGTLKLTFPISEKRVTQVAWLANGLLVAGNDDSILRWWSADGILLSEQKSGNCGIFFLAPAPEEAAIAATPNCDDPVIWR